MPPKMGGMKDKFKYLVETAKHKINGDLGVTAADIYHKVWKEYQKLAGQNAQANFWKILVSPADCESLGGTGEVARLCAETIYEIITNEDVGWGPYIVVCHMKGTLPEGEFSVQAECLSVDALRAEYVQASLLRDGICLSEDVGMPADELRQTAEFSLECQWSGDLYPLTDSVGVGRNSDNEIVIDDSSVGSFHGRFESSDMSPTGWAYIDMRSTFGSRVNDVPVSGTVLLNENDVIKLADNYTIVLRRSDAYMG